jgi:hypothetical protein
MKPALFVASSSEGGFIARGLQANLDRVADVTIWDQGVFLPGTMTLDGLTEAIADSDFGVFVFSPDDVLTLREEECAAVRDNVLFEFGLFVAKLGRKRVFMLRPSDSSSTLHLPADLLGLTGATYDAVKIKSGNVRAALGPACFAIENAIKKEWNEPPGLTKGLILLLRHLGRDDGTPMPVEYYLEDIAIFHGAPRQAGEQTARGWKSSLRYQLLCLELQGLVEVNRVTSILYKISSKGRKVLELVANKAEYRDVFERPIGPRFAPISDWGHRET